ncbi:MAG: TIGR03067 domain-containing protein [Gemmataceae bacterium]|nr:TIGR03067 domain-containing protein [Gemmataceae bacterium]
MKKLLAVTVGMLLLNGALAVGQDEDAAVKKDKELLKGLWKFESFETQQGKKDDFADATLKFSTDGKIEFSKGGEQKKATYKINPAGKPKEIDLKPEDKDHAMQGIYRIEKDTLTICVCEGQNVARPTEFEAKDKNVLVILKRVKD